MKKQILFLTLLISNIAFAQNLVLNPSFENYTTCPNAITQLTNAYHWTNPNAATTGSTPDLFNVCAPYPATNAVSVPYNVFGHQQPHTGLGYVGITTFYNSGGYPDFREYLQGELSTPLVAGRTYDVSFWISLSDVQYSAKNMGVYLSSTTQQGANMSFPLAYSPQLVNINNPLSDTVSWQKLEWSYTATGGERFFIIGNFDDDTNTDTVLTNPFGGISSTYYYIDDVSVSETLTSINQVNLINSLNLYPNPAADNVFLNIDLNEEKVVSVEIFNILGATVYSSNLGTVASSTLEIDTKKFLSGAYIVKIKAGNANYSKKLLSTGQKMSN